MNSLGDFNTAAVVYGKFTTTRFSTGAPFTLAGSPALSVYKDGSLTQSTAGVTLTADFDGVTGLNHFAVDTSADGTFYAAGSFYSVVVTTGTVDSVSQVGVVVGGFTLRKATATLANGVAHGGSTAQVVFGATGNAHAVHIASANGNGINVSVSGSGDACALDTVSGLGLHVISDVGPAGLFSCTNDAEGLVIQSSNGPTAVRIGAIGGDLQDVKVATFDGNLAGKVLGGGSGVITGTGARADVATTVDGLTLANALEALLALLGGVTSVSGNTVVFKKRDGTTTKVSVTYGDTPGERTASTIS